MSDTAAPAEAQEIPVRAMIQIAGVRFLTEVERQACRGWHIRVGGRVRVISGKGCPWGVYEVTKHWFVGYAAVNLRELVLPGSKKKPREFPRVPVADCEPFFDGYAAFSEPGWELPEYYLKLSGHANRLDQGTAWLVMADAIEDYGRTGWPDLDAYPAELVAAWFREFGQAVQSGTAVVPAPRARITRSVQDQWYKPA